MSKDIHRTLADRARVEVNDAQPFRKVKVSLGGGRRKKPAAGGRRKKK